MSVFGSLGSSLGSRLFRSRPDPRESLRPLWHTIVARSRYPEWYREAGVADTVTGRFDMITAILSLVLLRLEREPERAVQSALLIELFVEDMDGQLRESGVGDVVVGKHVGRLVSSLGGRLGAFREATASGEASLWMQAVDRNVTLLDGHSPDELSRRLRELSHALATQASHDLLSGKLPR
jgi:cytochrome b pre-mRNA-processing protein 3